MTHAYMHDVRDYKCLWSGFISSDLPRVDEYIFVPGTREVRRIQSISRDLETNEMVMILGDPMRQDQGVPW